MGMIGNSLAQGLISGANIQDGTVDTPDIKDGAVHTAKVADDAVHTAKIADGAVTAAKIADGAAVPSQTGQSGNYLTTDGTTASWGGLRSTDYIRVDSASGGQSYLTLKDNGYTSDYIQMRDSANGLDNLFSAGGGVVLNEQGKDVDFRVESDGNTHMLFVDAGNNRVGIGTGSPNSAMHLAGSGGGTILEMQRTNTNTTGSVGTINFTAMDGHSVANIQVLGDGDNEGAKIDFRTTSSASENSPFGSGTATRFTINANGTVHAVNGHSLNYIKTINLSTSYQDVVAYNTGLAPQGQGWLIAVSSENGYQQSWVIQTANSPLNVHYFGGDSGHTHSKDVQWQRSGGHIQAKKSYSTGRPLTIFMVAGSMSADYD